MGLRVIRWCIAMASVLVLASAVFDMASDDARGSPSRAADFAPAAGEVDRVALHASPFAASDTVVVGDDGVRELYALHGMLLYGRVVRKDDGWRPATTRRWMRVVNGLQLKARGIPAESEPFSIGRDATGRVVVVFGRRIVDGTVARWWLYDVAADTARRLRVRAHRGCVVDAVAIWRSRLAAVERCSEFKSHVVLHRGASTKRLTANIGTFSPRLMLWKRSLAVIVEFGVFEQTLWRVLDHGRVCPKAITGTVEENGIWAGIGSRTLTWAIAGYEFDGLRFSGLEVRDTDLSGRCQPSPVPRTTARSLLPQTAIHGAYRSSGPAIDGRKLYYATDTAIHRLRLPVHGVAEPNRER
jgi:hypothetical protein